MIGKKVPGSEKSSEKSMRQAQSSLQMYPNGIEGSNTDQIIVPEKSQGLPFAAG
jgi:hypothetical protein